MVIDLHWGAMLGVGWSPADPGTFETQIYATTTTTDVPAGAYDIPVSSIGGFTAGMLVNYLAIDGQRYAFRLRDRSTGLLKSDRPLPVGIASGGTLSNSYKDDAHPNLPFGATIVDTALRQINDPIRGQAREVEKVYRDIDAWVGASGAIVNVTPVQSYTYLGGDQVGERAAVIIGNAPIGDVKGPLYTPLGGDYIAKTVVNTGLRAGGENSVTVTVEEKMPDGSFQTIASSGLLRGYEATYLVEVAFHADGTKPVRLRVVSGGSGSSWNAGVGQIEFHRIVGPPLNLDQGKHVLFGDSWAVAGYPIATALAARLGNATVVAKGVNGNRSDQMVARFDADVTPENPDVVWVLVSTNDFYASVAAGVFEANLLILKNKILAIGAQPIFFTATVGANNRGQLFSSRRFATNVRYLDFAEPMPAILAPWRLWDVSAREVIVPAGQTRRIAFSAGQTKQTSILNLLACNATCMEVLVGFADDLSSFNLKDAHLFAGGKTVRNWWMKRSVSALSGFICIDLHNPGTCDQTASIAAQFAWKGDLS
ncbi:SGNH/GDSL hydrolase family protein [Pararhizobium sp.]|uniref:SGNH/GDSL hydrolase family protein n=1 Tax=Pararhizobium sp. TaxID=1977563 RepID=UPI0027258F2B|nr:SGNH/GDSL hydrolase family protein [Pararhizobium sp.]MDO9417048.1 SGNH/GDSL hydrolase family protein [Pararhizobium sp.]